MAQQPCNMLHFKWTNRTDEHKNRFLKYSNLAVAMLSAWRKSIYIRRRM